MFLEAYLGLSELLSEPVRSHEIIFVDTVYELLMSCTFEYTILRRQVEISDVKMSKMLTVLVALKKPMAPRRSTSPKLNPLCRLYSFRAAFFCPHFQCQGDVNVWLIRAVYIDIGRANLGQRFRTASLTYCLIP